MLASSTRLRSATMPFSPSISSAICMRRMRCRRRLTDAMPPAAAFCFRRGKMTDRGAYSARAACSNSGGFPGFRVYYAARPRAADRAIFRPGFPACCLLNQQSRRRRAPFRHRFGTAVHRVSLSRATLRGRGWSPSAPRRRRQARQAHAVFAIDLVGHLHATDAMPPAADGCDAAGGCLLF